MKLVVFSGLETVTDYVLINPTLDSITLILAAYPGSNIYVCSDEISHSDKSHFEARGVKFISSKEAKRMITEDWF
ncbi:MAG: hypothetical protein ACTSPB_03265 [Candidatus Thorarchaeota archaeon]